MVQCEHLKAAYPSGVVRCEQRAVFAVHDKLASLTWTCADHLAVTIADVSERMGLFVTVECFAPKSEPVALRRSQMALAAP